MQLYVGVAKDLADCFVTRIRAIRIRVKIKANVPSLMMEHFAPAQKDLKDHFVKLKGNW